MPSIKYSARQHTTTRPEKALVKVKSYEHRTMLTTSVFTALLLASLLMSGLLMNSAKAQTPPPTLGQETKGIPAVDEQSPLPKDDTQTSTTKSDSAKNNSENEEGTFLGTATITESRRENGQLYEIELDHSLGGKQYIQENDSDGKIESTSNDLEETPNLPKWKLGSW